MQLNVSAEPLPSIRRALVEVIISDPLLSWIFPDDHPS